MMPRLSAFNLIVCLINICVSAFDPSIFNGLEKIDDIQISHRTFHNSKRSLTHHPDIIFTTISVDNQTAELKFQQSKTFKHQPLIYLQHLGRGVLQDRPKDECLRFYQATDQSAHALVNTCNNDVDDVHMIAAEVFLKEELNILLPQRTNTEENQTFYGIYRTKNQADFSADYTEPKTEYTEPYRPAMSTIERVRRQTDSPVVEVLLVMDHSLFKFWYDFSGGNETRAIENINNFYGFFAQGVYMRFQGLSTYGIALDMEVTSIYILKTAADSYFTEGADFLMSTRGVLDVETLLASFKTWLDDKKASDSSFPKADHYMLLTARDVSLQGNQASAGYAYIDTICTSNSVSVVEDHFNFLSLTLAAHELGHALNGKHDSDVPGCSNNDNYILSATNQPMPGSAGKHPWQFSNCSAQTFKDKLAALDSEASNCLQINDATPVLVAVGTPPGQNYGPDEQCRTVYGPDSCMVRAQHFGHFEQMCTGMWCKASGISANLIIPAEGTTCGNKKWCSNGECVYSDTAPVADETCLFGDQPGKYSFGKTCEQTVESNPELCYGDEVSQPCCASCRSKQLNITGCPYGDKFDCGSIYDSQCYGANVEESCCKTCHNVSVKYSHLPPDCKYGDKYTNCSPRLCTQYPVECCETCYNAAQSTSKSTDTTRPTDANQQTSTSGSQASNTVSTQRTTSRGQTGQDDLPKWVIPVAAGGGGLLAVIVIIIVAVYCCSNSNRGSKYKDSQRNHKNKLTRRGYLPSLTRFDGLEGRYKRKRSQDTNSGKHDRRFSEDVRREAHKQKDRRYSQEPRSLDSGYGVRRY